MYLLLIYLSIFGLNFINYFECSVNRTTQALTEPVHEEKGVLVNDSQIRLYPGSRKHEGLVQVMLNGEWVNVCWKQPKSPVDRRMYTDSVCLKNHHTLHVQYYPAGTINTTVNNDTTLLYLKCTKEHEERKCYVFPNSTIDQKCKYNHPTEICCSADGPNKEGSYVTDCRQNSTQIYLQTPCHSTTKEPMSYEHASYVQLTNQKAEFLTWTRSMFIKVDQGEPCERLNHTMIFEGPQIRTNTIEVCMNHCLQSVKPILVAVEFKNNTCSCYGGVPFDVNVTSVNIDCNITDVFVINDTDSHTIISTYCIAMEIVSRSFKIQNCSRLLPILCGTNPCKHNPCGAGECIVTNYTSTGYKCRCPDKAYGKDCLNNTIPYPTYPTRDFYNIGTTSMTTLQTQSSDTSIGTAIIVVVVAVVLLAIIFLSYFGRRQCLKRVKCERQRPNSMSNRTYIGNHVGHVYEEETYNLINDSQLDIHVQPVKPALPDRNSKGSKKSTNRDSNAVTEMLDYTTPSDLVVNLPDLSEMAKHATVPDDAYTFTYDDPRRKQLKQLHEQSETLGACGGQSECRGEDCVLELNALDNNVKYKRIDAYKQHENTNNLCENQSRLDSQLLNIEQKSKDHDLNKCYHTKDIFTDLSEPKLQSSETDSDKVKIDLNQRISSATKKLPLVTKNIFPSFPNKIEPSDTSVDSDSTDDDSDDSYEDTSIIDGRFKLNRIAESNHKPHVCLHDFSASMLKRLGIRIVDDDNEYSTHTYQRRHSDLPIPTYYNIEHVNQPSVDDKTLKLTSTDNGIIPLHLPKDISDHIDNTNNHKKTFTLDTELDIYDKLANFKRLNKLKDEDSSHKIYDHLVFPNATLERQLELSKIKRRNSV